MEAQYAPPRWNEWVEYCSWGNPSLLNMDWDYLEHLVPGRRPSNPVVCSHLWKVRIPVALPVGEHRIEVRAKDRFGRVHTAGSAYRIEEQP